MWARAPSPAKVWGAGGGESANMIRGSHQTIWCSVERQNLRRTSVALTDFCSTVTEHPHVRQWNGPDRLFTGHAF